MKVDSPYDRMAYRMINRLLRSAFKIPVIQMKQVTTAFHLHKESLKISLLPSQIVQWQCDVDTSTPCQMEVYHRVSLKQLERCFPAVSTSSAHHHQGLAPNLANPPDKLPEQYQPPSPWNTFQQVFVKRRCSSVSPRSAISNDNDPTTTTTTNANRKQKKDLGDSMPMRVIQRTHPASPIESLHASWLDLQASKEYRSMGKCSLDRTPSLKHSITCTLTPSTSSNTTTRQDADLTDSSVTEEIGAVVEAEENNNKNNEIPFLCLLRPTNPKDTSSLYVALVFGQWNEAGTGFSVTHVRTLLCEREEMLELEVCCFKGAGRGGWSSGQHDSLAKRGRTFTVRDRRKRP